MKTKTTLKMLSVFMVCTLCAIYVLSNMYIFRNSPILTELFDALDSVILLILIAIILTSSFHTKTFFGVLFLTFYMFISYLITGMFDLLRAEIVILALKDTSARKTFRILFRTFIVSLGIVFVLYILGLSNAGEMRRGNIALGFGSPNVASKMIQSAVFLWAMWTAGAKVKYRNLVYLLVIAFVWITTGSRNSTIVLAAFPAGLYFFRKIINSRHEKKLQYVFYSLPLIFAAITLFLPQLYGRYAWVQGLNALFSNRIFMNGVALQKYGFSIVGQAANITEFSGIFDAVSQKYTSFLAIDCFYVYMLVYYGVVGLALALIATIAAMRKAWKNKNYVVLTVALMLCIYSILETTSSVFCLPFLIYLLVQDDISERINDRGQNHEHYHF